MAWTDIPEVKIGDPIADMDDWLNTYVSANLTFLFGAFTGALVYQSGAQSINDSTFTAVQYGAEAFDVGGWHDNSTNNTRLTVPSGADGFAIIAGCCGFETLTDGNARGCRVYKNGADVLGEAMWGRACDADNHGVFVRAYDEAAVAGDYYELCAYHERGSAANTVADRKYFFAARAVTG